MKNKRQRYIKIPLWEKVSLFVGLLLVIAVATWRIGGDVPTVVGVSAGIFASLHILITYPKLLLTSIVLFIHTALIPAVTVGYSVLRQTDTYDDYYSNLLILIFSSIIIGVITSRITRHSVWKVLATAFVSLDFIGLFISSYLLDGRLGATTGLIVAVIALGLWSLQWRKVLRRGDNTPTITVPLWSKAQWDKTTLPENWKVLNLDEEYYPLQKILITDKNVAFAVIGINPGDGLKVHQGSLFYRKGSVDVLYAAALNAAIDFSKKSKIDIRNLNTVLLSASALPDKKRILSFAIDSVGKGRKIQGIIHLLYLKNISNSGLTNTLNDKQLERLTKAVV